MAKEKYYVSTKRPNLKVNDKSLKETKITHNDDLHGVMDGVKTEHFAKLKKRLLKKMT